MTNYEIAERLEEIARILSEQGANRFRVNAYRRAAGTIRSLPVAAEQIARSHGVEGLQQLPGIGETLARLIHQLIFTGRLTMLDRLRGENDPVKLLSSVPGIGKKLAQRIHEELGIDSLEELEIAAHDGRLASMRRIGKKRLAGIRDSLAGRLGYRYLVYDPQPQQPPVSELLDIDREYLTKVRQGTLSKITPLRFNPHEEEWLPILHTRRKKRQYTALFSNTPLAHKLGKTRDWVVLYCDGGTGEHQYTIVTAKTGLLKGKRAIRGRETECRDYYSMQLLA